MDLEVDVEVEPLGAALRRARADDHALARRAIRPGFRRARRTVGEISELLLRLAEHVPHLLPSGRRSPACSPPPAAADAGAACASLVRSARSFIDLNSPILPSLFVLDCRSAWRPLSPTRAPGNVIHHCYGPRGGNRSAGRAARAGGACRCSRLLAVAGTSPRPRSRRTRPTTRATTPAEEGGPTTCLTDVGQRRAALPLQLHAAVRPGRNRCRERRRDMSQLDETAPGATSPPATPSTVIAYIEGGINWHNGDAAELRNRVYLNAGELPPPTTPDGAARPERRRLRRLAGHADPGRQQQRRRRSRGHHRPLLRRHRRRPQRLHRRHLGLGLLQRPERPGDPRLRPTATPTAR